MDKKFSLFVEDEKDILFPIFTEYNKEGFPKKIRSNFEEATLNGMMIHQKTFKAVGPFNDESLTVSKFLWAVEATQKGCRFKAVLGTRLL